MQPKLYQYEACPFCNKVSSLLAYKKAEYETIEVNPLGKKEIEFSADYKKVPIYIDSQGNQFNDSNQIMKRIDEEFPTPKVSGDDPKKEQKWLEWSEGLVQGLPTVIYDSFGNSIKAFSYIKNTGNFNWFQRVKIQYLGAFVMTLVSKKIKKKQGIENPMEFLKQKVSEWVEGLEGKDYSGGAKPNMADLGVYGIVRSVAELNAGPIFRENGSFSGWMDRMKEQTESVATPQTSLIFHSNRQNSLTGFCLFLFGLRKVVFIFSN